MSILNRNVATRAIAYRDSNGDIVDVTENQPLPTAPLPSTTSSLSVYESAALENTGVIKSSAGVLHGVDGFSQVAGFLQTFNATSVPSNGAVPKHSQPVAVNEAFSYDPPGAVDYSTGIVFALSSTVGTLTLIGTNQIVLYGYYI